jgi:hypothetical protein
MHFHLPKPLHGWRALVGEVGIIVIGVLIALGAEQVVETVHERTVANDTRRSIRQELDTGLASLALRQQAEPCIARRLRKVRQIVNEWGQTGRFTTPQWVSQSPRLGVTLARYDAASAAGRLALLPSDEQFQLGLIARGLRTFDDTQAQEAFEWAKLRELQSGPDALSVSDRSVIRSALQDESMLDFNMRIGNEQFLTLAATYGLHPNFAGFRARAHLTWKTNRFTPSICDSIDTPPEIGNRKSVSTLPE